MRTGGAQGMESAGGWGAGNWGHPQWLQGQQLGVPPWGRPWGPGMPTTAHSHPTTASVTAVKLPDGVTFIVYEFWETEEDWKR